MAVTSGSQIEQLLGDEAQALLTYEAHGIDKGQLHLPGPDFIDRVWMDSDRPVPVLRNLGQLFATGRLGGTGYLSILPRSEEHTSELQSRRDLVCRLLLEKKKKNRMPS